MIKLEFHGAARTVTGSAHIVRVNGKTILLECGLFQGKREETYQRNMNFQFDPAEIDVMILSHAHIDHSGNIPNLCRKGFNGPIICTHATRDLAHAMLLDSAFIQKKDAEFVNKKHEKKRLPPVQPLYTVEDVLNCIGQFQTIGYNRKFRVTENVDLTFYDAGHILGSALVVLDVHVNGSSSRFCFTGDLGRPGRLILKDPEFVGDVDVLISESTYGGRYHLKDELALVRIEDIMKRTIARNGKIIVPAFSVGRTQELVYDLHILRDQNRLPDIPIYVDSPLSVNITQIFRIHPECFDAEIRNEILQRHDPFGFEQLEYISNVNDSKDLNDQKGPMMIISSSGMCEAGRILHHLANNIENARNTIMITGYCADHTLGKRIVEKDPEVPIFGEKYKLKAEVAVMNSLSAHADRDELMNYIKQFNHDRLQNIFLVHGDYDQQQKLSDGLKTELGFSNITIPQSGDVIEI